MFCLVVKVQSMRTKKNQLNEEEITKEEEEEEEESKDTVSR